VKSIAGVHLINESPEYRPYFISPIKPRAIELPDVGRDTEEAKEAICEIVQGIRFFTRSTATASNGSLRKDMLTLAPREPPNSGPAIASTTQLSGKSTRIR
jgi:hypothetical protein